MSESSSVKERDGRRTLVGGEKDALTVRPMSPAQPSSFGPRVKGSQWW